MFNRCFTSNGLPVDNPKYAITMEYEFLDDVNLEWAGFTEGREMDGHGVDAVMSMIRAALPENAQKQLQIKSSHPLMLMVRIQGEGRGVGIQGSIIKRGKSRGRQSRVNNQGRKVEGSAVKGQ